MRNFQRINTLIGLLLFTVSATVYWLTMEPTVSFWDCGEFIAAAYKLQVGHQPGAPLFLMIGKIFSLLAGPDSSKIPYWINFSSVLFSAATIMFLYWTITLIGSKLYIGAKSVTDTLTIISAGVVGALAYTFSDTFWFSAVEAEVYSLSSLFTAIVFWAIFKWESSQNDRWIVFIAFIIGLSIGIHLLSLLTIPAIVLVYYFKKTVQPNVIGVLKALGIAGLLWAIVQIVIIQFFVLLVAKFDIFFVNTLGFSFGSGAIFFLAVLVGSVAYAIFYSIKNQKYYLNLGLVCTSFVLLGFSAYFMIIIRANAKPTLNLSNPDNAYSLYNYLGRTNYGQTPLLYGQTFDANRTNLKETGTDYRKGKEKYEVSGKLLEVEYDKNLLFPRTYSKKPQHPDFYKQWLGLMEGETPSFSQNLSFFFSYQVGYMYWRYFLWNFAGKQNDFQGQGSYSEGNWLTGIKALDALRLGSQEKLPLSITNNEGYNRYFGLPLILGMAGLVFLYRKNKKDTMVITTLFLFTGLAIIVYLNQDPLQVRERDYAYVGSFYAFCIFIGFGVFAIKELLSRVSRPAVSLAGASLAALFAAPAIMGYQGWDDHNRAGKTTGLEWAANYLNSCAPNAILFTNADNDTFPLWYAQEVEGIRTDVRVVNLQYLSDSDYIEQMKKHSGKSAPLPIKTESGKLVKGLREGMPYVNYGFTDSVELKDILAVLTSDDPDDKVQMSDGSWENFLPAKSLKLTVNPEAVIKSNTIPAKDKNNIATEMEWTFGEHFATKANLVMFDILVNNNWERPIYFGSGISNDSYIGLESYLYLEGYAHRLLPLKPDQNAMRTKDEVTNSEVMFTNVMHKFNFKGFTSAKYLDPESRRIVRGTWRAINNLSVNLIMEGNSAKAKQIINKSIMELPTMNYSIDDTLNKIQTIQNLYLVHDVNAANELAVETADFLDQELTYIASLEGRRQNAYMNDIKVGLFVLDGLKKISLDHKQARTSKMLDEKYERLKNNFI